MMQELSEGYKKQIGQWERCMAGGSQEKREKGRVFTMKSYLSFAWKELKAQKVTSVLILLAVILSAVVTTAMGQSIGILQSMRIEQAAGLNGDRYVTFHQLTKEQRNLLYEDSRLKDVGSYITVGSMELPNSSLTLFLREFYDNALSAYPGYGTMKEGRLPLSEGEIALSADALKYLGLDAEIGGRITLPLEIGLLTDDRPKYEYEADFVLTGILENNYLGYAAGILEGVAGEGTAEARLPGRYLCYSTDIKTVSVKGFQSTIDDLVKRLDVPERCVQYNWVLLDAMGVDYPDKEGASRNIGFPFMTAACIMAGALVLLAAGLVVYNILKVTVMKRIREYGTLRSLGGERGQLYALVTVQIILLSMLGLPWGMLLGVISSKGILIAATGLLSPELFMADTTGQLKEMIANSERGGILPLLGSVIVILVFAMLAAYPSAVYASRVSPAIAMGGQAARIKRRDRKTKKIRNFEAFYARLNLRRNRGRTIVTIVSIVMSITVFVTLQSFSGLLDASRSVQEMHTGDYCITNETLGIGPEEIKRLGQNDLVAKLATAKLAVYTSDADGNMPVNLDLMLHPGESFQIAAVDEERISSCELETELTKEDRQAIRNGEACLAVNPIPVSWEGQEMEYTQLQKGDAITVNGYKLQIAGITRSPVCINNAGFINGVQIIGTDELYNELVGDDKYSEVFPSLKEDTDPEEFERWLDEWCEENPGTHWLSYRQSDEQTKESFEQIRLLCWGLVLLMGLIGALNIINTVYTNIHTRVNEIGVQRAIGMDAGSLYRTFLWEGAYYGLTASGIGAACGYVCTVFVDAAANDELRLSAFPASSVLTASIVSVAACFIATAIPLRAVGRLSIVESIETVE